MTPTRIHELNKLAGEFCGKKLTGQFSHGGERWVYASYEDECTMQYTQWNPSENHEQAAEVKAMLREKGYGYAIGFDKNRGAYGAMLYPPKGMMVAIFSDESELIALLLAVEALTKKEPS